MPNITTNHAITYTNTDSDMAFSSITEKTGFEILTRDIRDVPQRTSLNCVDNLRQICPPIFFRTYFAYFLSKFMKIILLKNLFFKEVGYCTHSALFLRIVCFTTSIYAKKNHTFLSFHLSLYLHGCHAVSLKKTKQFPCFDNVIGLKKNWPLFRIAYWTFKQVRLEHTFLPRA